MNQDTIYYSKGTEQKSYMNTLREYMFKNGMINNIGDKVTSRQIKKAIRSLPNSLRMLLNGIKVKRRKNKSN